MPSTRQPPTTSTHTPPHLPQLPASWATATRLPCPRPSRRRPPRAPPSCSTSLHSCSPTGCSEAIPTIEAHHSHTHRAGDRLSSGCTPAPVSLGTPRDPSAPCTAQRPLPFQSRTHHVSREGIEKKECPRATEDTTQASSHTPLTSLHLPLPLPSLQGSRLLSCPCPASGRAFPTLCRPRPAALWALQKLCPTQRCLTPGKPKSAVN